MRLIDADALYETAKNIWDHADSEDFEKEIFIAIATAPTIEERKNGKWIYSSPVTMKCDQCGFVIKDWDWHRFKICPNCGADMRGEQDE